MTCNVGGIDRILRLLLGAALCIAALAGAFAPGIATLAAGLVGLVLVATGALRFCPAYLPFGIRTCRR